MNKQTLQMMAYAAAIMIGGSAVAAPAQAHNGTHKLPKQFVTKLSGAAEVGVAGDPDGVGVMRVNVKQESSKPSQVCFSGNAFSISKVVKLHMHNAPAGVNGPVVVDFAINEDSVRVTKNGRTRFKACTTVDDALATAIRENSANYYVNVHTDEFPQGALRGQLPGVAKAASAQPQTNDSAHSHNEAPAAVDGYTY
jgi:hypothetical protein